MSFFERHKKGIIVVLLAFFILLMAFSFRYNKSASLPENLLAFFVTPAQKIATQATNFIKNIGANKEDLVSNENLELQISLLNEKISRLELYEKENQRLSELLDIKQKYSEHETIGAQVIARSAENWLSRLTIDKGKKHGVESKMLVLTHEGLLGYTKKVGNNFSQVLLLTDEQSSMSVMNKRTEGIGVLRGDFELSASGLCRVDYISLDGEIVVGDEFVTSYLSGFPAGILVGSVVEVKMDINGLTKYAVIEPAASNKALDSVLVISESFVDPESDF